MTEKQPETSTASCLPPDDLRRSLTVAPIDDPTLRHIALAGGTYTILLSGDQTNGRYCLIDMSIPPGGGPPEHRHDFEEMFTVLEGDIELMFRGEKKRVSQGTTVNIPANAPHAFKNTSSVAAHLLCLCTPPGQEDYFLLVGDVLETRTSPPPVLTPDQKAERGAKAKALAAKFKTEF